MEAKEARNQGEGSGGRNHGQEEVLGGQGLNGLHVFGPRRSAENVAPGKDEAVGRPGLAGRSLLCLSGDIPPHPRATHSQSSHLGRAD